MATEDELRRALINADRAGDTRAAQMIADRIASMRQNAPSEPLTAAPRVQRSRYGNEANRRYSSLEGGLGVVDALAGAGRSVYETGRGISQLFGGMSEEEVERQRELDAPLANSTAGQIGGITGTLAQFVGPGAIAKGGAGVASTAGAARTAAGLNRAARVALPTTFGGNVAQGAALGYIQPVGERDSRLGNAAMGAGFAGAGYAIPGLIRGARATVVDPLTNTGNDRIIGNTLRRFATDEKALRTPAQSPIKGVNYTLAEATADPGIASLQRAAAADPKVSGPLALRESQNNLARVQALEGIAGQPGAIDAAVAARGRATAPLYDAATSMPVLIDDGLRKLMTRPSVKDGLRIAARKALEEGKPPPKSGDLMNSQTLQYVDQHLSDEIGRLTTAGKKGEAKAIKSTQDALRQWMETQLPEYMQAQTAFRQMSRPIDQMKVGREVLKRGQSAAADPVTGAQWLRPDSTMRAIGDLDTTAQRATRFRQARADQIMDPAQLQTMRDVSETLSRRQNAQNSGRAVGSNTMQNLYSQNLMSSFGLPDALSSLGPIGRIGNIADSAMRIAGVPERLQARLAEVLANPAEAQAILAKLPTKDREVLQRAIASAGARGLLGAD